MVRCNDCQHAVGTDDILACYILGLWCVVCVSWLVCPPKRETDVVLDRLYRIRQRDKRYSCLQQGERPYVDGVFLAILVIRGTIYLVSYGGDNHYCCVINARACVADLVLPKDISKVSCR